MESETDVKKWANFYLRLRKQYQQGKPFTYEVDLASSQPKPRAAKFMIMITKFISIFKWGIRQTYDNQDDRRENYWTQLSKNFHSDLQMGFVNQGYWQKPKNKIKKYFALLVHTKRIFKVLEEILNKMGYIYQNQQQKRKNYNQQIKNLNFLEDGNYKIMGQIITSFEQYANKRRQQQRIKQIQKEKEQKRKQQQQKKRLERQKQQQQQRRQRQRKQKQEQQRRLQVQIKMKQLQQKKQQEEAQRLITSQYFPSDYKAAFSLTPQQNRLKKDPSTHKLDLPNHNQREGKIKNSERLYLQQFKGQTEVFSYSLKPEISEDKSICYACKCNLKEGIYILGGNQNLCYYTGKWYCNNDISQDRMAIPWKAVQKFDLKGYTVSKVAYAQLKAYYQKPILQIKRQNPIIKENKKLHEFLVVKRQIHLIYDSICNLELIQPIVKGRKNYCLKINLFSMKNFYDIYNGQQTNKWQKEYQLLSKHFYKCDICQKKKGYICPICKDPVKIFPFQLKQTIGCSPCRKLYHRKCLPNGQCKCKEQQQA